MKLAGKVQPVPVLDHEKNLNTMFVPSHLIRFDRHGGWWNWLLPRLGLLHCKRSTHQQSKLKEKTKTQKKKNLISSNKSSAQGSNTRRNLGPLKLKQLAARIPPRSDFRHFWRKKGEPGNKCLCLVSTKLCVVRAEIVLFALQKVRIIFLDLGSRKTSTLWVIAISHALTQHHRR